MSAIFELNRTKKNELCYFGINRWVTKILFAVDVFVCGGCQIVINYFLLQFIMEVTEKTRADVKGGTLIQVSLYHHHQEHSLLGAGKN